MNIIDIAQKQTDKKKLEKVLLEQECPKDLRDFIILMHKKLSSVNEITQKIEFEIKWDKNILPISLVNIDGYCTLLWNITECKSNFFDDEYLKFINYDIKNNRSLIKNSKKYNGTRVSLAIETGPFKGGFLNVQIIKIRDGDDIYKDRIGLIVELDSKPISVNSENIIVVNKSNKWIKKLLGKPTSEIYKF